MKIRDYRVQEETLQPRFEVTPKRKVESPSLAGGAKHRDFTVNHGVFITFSPIIQFSTEAIPGVAAPQPPEMDSNDFCLLC